MTVATVAPTAAGSSHPYAGETMTFAVSPQSPVETEAPDGTRLTNTAGGGIRAESTRAAHGQLYAEWRLSASVLPAGARVVDVHTLVCGHGSGDFYEVYGPYGATEVEYEVTPPSADGCWHFTKDPGTDYQVEIYLNNNSVMTIERIEFRVTFGN